jgi:hypothetical protein
MKKLKREFYQPAAMRIVEMNNPRFNQICEGRVHENLKIPLITVKRTSALE